MNAMRCPVHALDVALNRDAPERGPQPREALEFFEAKGLKPGFSHEDVWAEEHLRSFTAAKFMREDVLQATQDELDKALSEGKTYEQFAKNIEAKLQAKGFWGKQQVTDPATGETADVDVPSRMKLIYDTNMRTARAAGQWERIQRTKDTHPFLLYRLGPSENHREQHVAWHGTLLPADDPWWQEHFPPNGFNCRCRTRQVSKREAARLERDGITAPDARQIIGPDGLPTGRRENKKTPVKRERPPVRKRVYVNKRTGERREVPEGIQPGFDRPPAEMKGFESERKPSLPFRASEESAGEIEDIRKVLSDIPGKQMHELNFQAADQVGEDPIGFANEWKSDWVTGSTTDRAAGARIAFDDNRPIKDPRTGNIKPAEEWAKDQFEDVETYRKAMRWQYAATQELLARKGVQEVTVYRGLSPDQAEPLRRSRDEAIQNEESVHVAVRPVSSWTPDPEAASEFAAGGGLVIKAKVPASQVFADSSVDRGFVGFADEQEIVVYTDTDHIEVSPHDVLEDAKEEQ